MSGNLANYRLGRRVPVPLPDLVEATHIFGLDLPSRIFGRSSSTTTCVSSDNADLCEKPASSGNTATIAIVLGVVIPVVGAICVLLFLHRRNVKRTRIEDELDAQKALDFGMDMAQPRHGKAKRKSVFGVGGEKSASQRQLSIDMDLSSPYLLPPELHNSRESLNTLARSIHQNEDPYRPVTQYASSDVASLRSFRKDAGSIYTRSSSAYDTESRKNSVGPQGFYNAKPHAVPPPYFDKETASSPVMRSPPPTFKSSFAKETVSELDAMNNVRPDSTMTGAKELPSVSVSEIQFPTPAAGQFARKGLPSPAPAPPKPRNQSMSEAGDELFIYDKLAMATATAMPEEPKHDQATKAPMLPETLADAGQFSFNVTSFPDMPTDDDDLQAPMTGAAQLDDDRGRTLHRRQSSEYPPEDNTLMPSGLDLPEADSRRLSVGFRPLPPSEITESEDPETRANRIRSFYKEYFDDSRPDMAEYNQHYPPNGIPAQFRGGRPNRGPGGGPQYPGGSGAYFDPASNSFVMPYAQPVSRRAMTPPPSGSRMPGARPRFGPGHHGSMGGMSMGMGGHPGSRPGTNMSARPPSKPMEPLADLLTLPTPSMLKDDAMSLLGVLDFAPAPTFADKVSGRPQSPMGGERRPYQVNVPVSSPLVSSFDEMMSLPSPHVLRKSSTFTGLDFAPPRKFRDADTMSDAGSIRSNRSGISPAQQFAIRSGAGRVSRLPGDNVFTQAAMADQLKPSWGLRS